MSLLSDLRMYGRFATGLHGFLRQRVSLEEARRIVPERIRRRGETFLRILARGVFDRPRSPYLALLKLAGCELGDVERMVRTDGLEAALGSLCDAGVYVTFEEFKGRTPIVRHGREIRVTAHDFDNPWLKRCYEAESGGSTGAPTRIGIDLDHSLGQMPTHLVVKDANGMLEPPTVLWWATLPALAGLSAVLSGPVAGTTPTRWFSPIGPGDSAMRLKHRVATQFMLTVARLLGVPVPWPQRVRADNVGPALRCVERTLERHGTCRVSTFVSSGLRLCVAAADRGMDLTGVIFSVSGEPPTPAKVSFIRSTGARCVPSYYVSEAGIVGGACARPVDENDLHVAMDCVALIQRPHEVPGVGMSVDAFHLTTLLPTAPKLMLNVATDDFGVLETRSCGCPLEGYGYTQHVRAIRSYGKLTGEGVTLINSDMVPILEQVLPARFGGSPLDYQLLEEEDERGFTRLCLLVDPSVRLPDEKNVVDVVLESMHRAGHAGTYAANLWEQANSLTVRRGKPIWSAGGKFMPLWVAERSARPAAKSRR